MYWKGVSEEESRWGRGGVLGRGRIGVLFGAAALKGSGA